VHTVDLQKWLLDWFHRLQDEHEHGISSIVLHPLKWSDPDDAIALVLSMLKSKPLIARRCCSVTLRLLATSTLQAFLGSLHSEGKTRLQANVRVLSVAALPFQASEALKGQLLLDLPLTLTVPRAGDRSVNTSINDKESFSGGDGVEQALTLALFDVSLVPFDPDGAVPGLRIYRAGDDGDDERAMSALLSALLHLRVGVVVSQKLVHPWLHRQLEAAGVWVIPRVAARHMSFIQRLSGASPHPDPWAFVGNAGDDADEGVSGARLPFSSLGAVHPPKIRYIGGRQYVVLRAPRAELVGALSQRLSAHSTLTNATTFERNVLSRRSSVATLLVCGPDRNVVSEVSIIVEGALVCLERALAEPWLLRGGGVWEAAAAAELRRNLDVEKARGGLRVDDGKERTSSRTVRRGIQVFIECLEATAFRRCGPTVWSQAKAAASAATSTEAQSRLAQLERPLDVESFASVANALQFAVDASSCVMRIRAVARA